MSILTAAPDTVLADGREVCIVRARELQPGDVIQATGAIDLRVTSVGRHPDEFYDAWLWIDYSIGRVTGSRAMVSDSFVAILPRTAEAAH